MVASAKQYQNKTIHHEENLSAPSCLYFVRTYRYCQEFSYDRNRFPESFQFSFFFCFLFSILKLHGNQNYVYIPAELLISLLTLVQWFVPNSSPFKIFPVKMFTFLIAKKFVHFVTLTSFRTRHSFIRLSVKQMSLNGGT